MEDQDKTVTQYLIPANVSARFEFFEGFGWAELRVVILACLIGTGIFFGLGMFKKTVKIDNSVPIEMQIGAEATGLNNEARVPVIPGVFRSLAIIIPGAGAFLLVKKDPSNGMSLIYLVKSSKEFKKKQKLYLYKYRSGSEE